MARTKVDAKSALQRLRELADPCEVQLSRSDPNRGTLSVLTTLPGRLLGPKGSIAKQFSQDTGWRVNVGRLSVPADVAIQKALGRDGCRRCEVLSDDEERPILHAVFDLGTVPDRDAMGSFLEQTGWQIKPVEEEGPLPAEKAYEILSQQHRAAVMVGYKEFADVELRIWAVSPGQVARDGDPSGERLRRMVGWKSVTVQPADQMPDSARTPGTEWGDGLELELSIMKRRCAACLGAGTVGRPSIDVNGLSWRRQICPSCQGVGDRRGRTARA